MTFCMDNIQESDNSGIGHLLQERNLADGGRWDAFVFGFQSDLLEGDDAVGVGEIFGFVDDAVCP